MRTNGPFNRVRFGLFEVDLRAGELTKRGARLKLQEQPFQVLAMLLERPGELVTREDLRIRLWPRTIVDFDHGLNKAISKIRETLGDSPENPRFVETVARRGYRFLGEVTPVYIPEGQSRSAQAGKTDIALADLAISAAPKRTHRRWWIFGSALAVTLSALLSLILYPASDSFPKIRSLAVLPLENFSGDASQDYFADGMTEELITNLGQISALRVISRTSVMTYKRARKSLPQIAAELNVEAVVEGSVLHLGDRVRITAQLIQVPADKHIWTQTYEEDIRDTLTLQNKVARAIAEQIKVTLNKQEQVALGGVKTVNPDAYRAYLTGRHYWNKRTAGDLKKAIDYFNRAVEKDPKFAAAYSGLADAYALSGDWEYGISSPESAFPQAKAAASKALALDDTLAEAHTSLAFVSDLYDWNWQAAEREYKRAIALNPGYATTHHWYAWHLVVMGRNDEALAEMKKAGDLDPLSPIISAELAAVLCIAKLYDESVQQSQRTLELHPNFAIAHYELAQAFAQKGMHDRAISELGIAIDLSNGNAAFNSELAYVYAISGRAQEAIRMAEELRDRQERPSSTDAHLAMIYVGLGNHDEAMRWLKRAFVARFNPSILMRPAFDPLRSDARFQDLSREIGLLQ